MPAKWQWTSRDLNTGSLSLCSLSSCFQRHRQSVPRIPPDRIAHSSGHRDLRSPISAITSSEQVSLRLDAQSPFNTAVLDLKNTDHRTYREQYKWFYAPARSWPRHEADCP